MRPTLGRIVIVRLKHGWRCPAVVVVAPPSWDEEQRIHAFILNGGAPLALLDSPLKPSHAGELERDGVILRAAAPFVAELSLVNADDENAVGWFWPPKTATLPELVRNLAHFIGKAPSKGGGDWRSDVGDYAEAWGVAP